MLRFCLHRPVVFVEILKGAGDGAIVWLYIISIAQCSAKWDFQKHPMPNLHKSFSINVNGEQDGREDIILQNANGNGKAVQEWGCPTDGHKFWWPMYQEARNELEVQGILLKRILWLTTFDAPAKTCRCIFMHEHSSKFQCRVLWTFCFETKLRWC